MHVHFTCIAPSSCMTWNMLFGNQPNFLSFFGVVKCSETKQSALCKKYFHIMSTFTPSYFGCFCMHFAWIWVNLTAKNPLGSMIPSDLTANLKGGSMICVDLATKLNAWIYDPVGSRIQIHGIGSRIHFGSQVPMSGRNTKFIYFEKCHFLTWPWP